MNHDGSGKRGPKPLQINQVSRDRVVKLTHVDGGSLYVRQFDVAAALIGAQGHRHVYVGGQWFPVQETIPGIFAKLGWEQAS